MSMVNLQTMRAYLSSSIAGMNQNKLNGLLAEVDFRNYLSSQGFGNRVSVGGWIARSEGEGNFGRKTIVFFPEKIIQTQSYPAGRQLPSPPDRLHTICATFHQIGILSYYLSPTISAPNDPASITWNAKQLGVPSQNPWIAFPAGINGFRTRSRRYNFLRNASDVSAIPALSIEEEFSKEHARIAFQNAYMSEMSDVDGILWGNQYTYPIEIKEKTVANDNKLGDYFGLDLGPFVKLAFYAAKRGNLHSIFVVREIDDPVPRNLIAWWYIKFDDLAQFASWTPVGGGRNMLGGGSTTVKIPKDQFKRLDAHALSLL